MALLKRFRRNAFKILSSKPVMQYLIYMKFLFSRCEIFPPYKKQNHNVLLEVFGMQYGMRLYIFLSFSLFRLLRDFHKYGIQVSLAMFLLHEKLLGNKSFWFPYLSTLPKTFTTPAFLPDNQLATLPPFLNGT